MKRTEEEEDGRGLMRKTLRRISRTEKERTEEKEEENEEEDENDWGEGGLRRGTEEED